MTNNNFPFPLVNSLPTCGKEFTWDINVVYKTIYNILLAH